MRGTSWIWWFSEAAAVAARTAVACSWRLRHRGEKRWDEGKVSREGWLDADGSGEVARVIDVSQEAARQLLRGAR